MKQADDSAGVIASAADDEECKGRAEGEVREVFFTMPDITH